MPVCGEVGSCSAVLADDSCVVAIVCVYIDTADAARECCCVTQSRNICRL